MTCYIVVETQKSPDYPFETFAGHATREEVLAEFAIDPDEPTGRQFHAVLPFDQGQRWVAVIDCPNRQVHE